MACEPQISRAAARVNRQNPAGSRLSVVISGVCAARPWASGRTSAAAIPTATTTGIDQNRTGRQPYAAPSPGTMNDVTATAAGTPAVFTASPTACRATGRAAVTETLVPTLASAYAIPDSSAHTTSAG